MPRKSMPQVLPLPMTIDDLLADPSRSKELTLESIGELFAELAARIAALKTLEGVLLSIMLNQRGGADHGQAASELLTAPEVAQRWHVPESWVREQARLGVLPFVRLGHYVRFRPDELERFASERRKQGV
jgi:excisionase family DNA binding protein